ncbi:MAG: YibE/F family protein [Lachnospiraceae bacterium]|nr:YibE/F family protein [Lachnospiraceae bacterium]
MKKHRILFTKKRNIILTLLFGFIITGILLALPTGYEDALIYQGTERATVTVLSVNNDNIITNGMVQSGEQRCELQVENGLFAGQTVSGVNFLSGSLAQDKIFSVGDKALAVISHNEDDITYVTMSDHFRLDKEFILLALFFALLVIFAGKNGLLSFFSFVITILSIWKILIPCYLNGMNPVWIGIGITIFLTLTIIFFVYGIDRRTLVASMGSLLGTATTCIMGITFTNLFSIHGAVMESAEGLLYSGYTSLNLTQIFMSSIFIGASGAMMDLSVDITSAVHEVVQKKPDIAWREAVGSGMNVGRAAMGTMTTTLLLSYSGGYVCQLMTFMAQGTPVDHILNYKYVAAEILNTIVGSFGLVTVAPITALVAGILLTRKEHARQVKLSLETKEAGTVSKEVS